MRLELPPPGRGDAEKLENFFTAKMPSVPGFGKEPKLCAFSATWRFNPRVTAARQAQRLGFAVRSVLDARLQLNVDLQDVLLNPQTQGGMQVLEIFLP